MAASPRFSGWLVQIPAENIVHATAAQCEALAKSADAINRMFGTDAYECSGQGQLPYIVHELVGENGKILRTGA